MGRKKTKKRIDINIPADVRYDMIFQQRMCPECRTQLEETKRGLFCSRCNKQKAATTEPYVEKRYDT